MNKKSMGDSGTFGSQKTMDAIKRAQSAPKKATPVKGSAPFAKPKVSLASRMNNLLGR